MSHAQVKRAGRLVEVRARVVDRLEIEFAQHVRATAEAENAAKSLRDTWDAAASKGPSGSCSSADLAEAYGYRVALMRKVELLASRAKQARLQEEGVREKLRVAKTELRKIEMWRDRLALALHVDEATKERKASDDVAARIARNA
jgi:flagellar export protein FliJ